MLHFAGMEGGNLLMNIKNDGVVKAFQKHPVSANCL